MGRINDMRDGLPQATSVVRPNAGGAEGAGPLTAADAGVPKTGRLALHGHG
ncbi:hypothetical protein ACH4FX_37950 [Streptomyces sp. NPDC018019]|uniref:hypothetical protein n=1 Tax=Streptomyces sp. NPDC018019 TaxID=3365030 RepID=UPI00379CF256